MFIFGQGIDSSILGLASHFSIVSGVPSIGISNNLIDCQIIENEIYKNKKRVGKVLVKKSGSRPIYISPGNNISIDSAFNFCNNFIRLPHKLPEPLHLANKYSNKVRKEIKIN
jgi:deoxyribonuclease V